VVSTKIETPNKLNKDNRTLLDGTKLRASKTFWTDLKSLEGAIGTNGSPVLNAYRLGDGRTTIGWGHTGAMSGKTPKMGDVITKEQAQELLNVDATEAANCVRRFLMGWKKQGLNSYMITQNMFDVLVSLSFNSGCPNLRSSEFIKLVKKGKHTEAAKLLPTDSTMIHGGFTKGLTARRKKESKQFLK
jgi:lysozyme